jgi:HlyD family secretion protein
MATIAETRQKFTRSEALARKRLLAHQELEIDQAALTRVEAEAANVRVQINPARARLNANHTDLRKAVIRAPIDSIVLSRNVEPGQTDRRGLILSWRC